MDVIPFMFESNRVRAVRDEQGEPLFVAADVAAALGYAKPENAVSRHCRATLKRGIPTLGGMQDMTVIPERDVYRLIMRSKLPSAQHFEEWVVGEVLPAIRKTGSYGVDPMLALNDPAMLRGLLANYSEKVIALEGRVAEQAPKVAALDRIATHSDGSLCITDAAKQLQIPPKKLFALMSCAGWIYRRAGSAHWTAYQDKIKAGLLEHKITTVSIPGEDDRMTTQVRVKAKGIARLSIEISNPQGALSLDVTQ